MTADNAASVNPIPVQNPQRGRPLTPWRIKHGRWTRVYTAMFGGPDITYWGPKVKLRKSRR